MHVRGGWVFVVRTLLYPSAPVFLTPFNLNVPPSLPPLRKLNLPTHFPRSNKRGSLAVLVILRLRRRNSSL